MLRRCARLWKPRRPSGRPRLRRHNDDDESDTMADSITIEVDASGVEAALNRFGVAAQPFINDASKETADAFVTEARARLQRQLGPNATGKTVAGITARPAYDGNGYVVVDEREPFPNVPFWLEKGTKHMDPREFFYSSMLLQVSDHQRRLGDALQKTVDAEGLGG